MSDADSEPASVPTVPGSSESGAASAAGHGKWVVFLIAAVLSLIADQATKIWARESLPTVRLRGGEATCIVPDDLVRGSAPARPDRPEARPGQAEDPRPACAGRAVPVIDGFWEWRLSMNPGSAFGLFSSQEGARIGLSIVGIVAVFGMLWMLRKARSDQRILHWALALVTGGAVGNLIDRIYFGVVTDFILWRYQTHEWPVFNVADIVLVVGVGLMFIDIQKEGRRDKALKATRQARAKAAGLVKTFGNK
jgi:signal peptidase II